MTGETGTPPPTHTDEERNEIMRFRPYGIAGHGDKSRMPVRPQDYSDARFEGIRCGYDRHKNLVIIMRSRETAPLRWRVVFGHSQVFFRSLAEAVDFCNSQGFRMMREQVIE